MQGTAMIFGAQTSRYFLRLMTLYLSHSLLLGDTGVKETSLKNTRGHGGVDKDKCTAYGDQIFNYTQGYDDNPMQLKALYSKRMPSQTPTTTPPPLCLSEEKTKGDKMES